MNRNEKFIVGGLVTMNGILASLLAACLGWGYLVAPQQKTFNFDLKQAIKKENVKPIVIIGSGPAGLGAALYGARANIETVVIEGNKPGGLLTETTEVANWLGEKTVMGPALMKKTRAHVAAFGVPFLPDMVESIDVSSWPFKITTEDGHVMHALSLIITTGASPRKLGVPGEQLEGVSSCATCDAPFYKGEDVVVVGGGDSAVEEAMQLAKHVRTVTILVRKDKMRAAASMQEHLKGYPNIKIVYNVDVQEILGDGQKVTALKLFNNKTNESYKMPISGVFLAVGHDPNNKLFKGQIPMDKDGYILMNGRTQETLVKGVFAAGDIEDRRYRQAFIAGGHGNAAALDAAKFLDDIGFNNEVAAQITEYKKHTLHKNLPSKVTVIKTLQELETTIKQHEVVVVDFYADYCPSCLQMLPAYDAVSKEFEHVTFIKVDVEEASDIADEYKIYKIPCILVFKEGKLAARFTRAMSKSELREFVSQF